MDATTRVVVRLSRHLAALLSRCTSTLHLLPTYGTTLVFPSMTHVLLLMRLLTSSTRHELHNTQPHYIAQRSSNIKFNETTAGMLLNTPKR